MKYQQRARHEEIRHLVVWLASLTKFEWQNIASSTVPKLSLSKFVYNNHCENQGSDLDRSNSLIVLCLISTYEGVHTVFVFLDWVTSLRRILSASILLPANFKMSLSFYLWVYSIVKCITFSSSILRLRCI